MLDPIGSRSLVSNQKTKSPSCIDDQIPEDHILSFNSVFKKNTMSFVFVDNITLKMQLLYTMERDASIVALVNSNVFDVRTCNTPSHVEMYRISSIFVGLTCIVKLYV